MGGFAWLLGLPCQCMVRPKSRHVAYVIECDSSSGPCALCYVHGSCIPRISDDGEDLAWQPDWVSIIILGFELLARDLRDGMTRPMSVKFHQETNLKNPRGLEKVVRIT